MPKIINYLYDPGLSEQALDFLESSKVRAYDAAEYSQRLNTVMGNPYFMEHIAQHTTELGFCETVALPPASPAAGEAAQQLAHLNQARRSRRSYGPAGLTLAQVSDLLRLAYCVTDTTNLQAGLPPTRNIASGGGLYPIDVYYVSRNTQGLRQGIYHYNLTLECLERLPGHEDAQAFEQTLSTAFFTEQKVDMDYRTASGYLVLGGVLNRSCFKYLDRGVRFALLDAGALTHSIYLASTALHIGCCGMGSYDDDLANQLIGFQGSAQQVLGIVVIGTAP